MKTLDFRHLAAALLFVTLLAAAGGATAAPLTLTADIDADFVGQPGVIIKQGTNLIPPYTDSSPPLSPIRADGTQMIQPDATIPSGFHINRVAVNYDCATDTLYIGLDVSNPTTDPADVPTGEISRAWDADGDGNPCTVCNSMLVNPTPNCSAVPPQYGLLDPQLVGNGNQDIPLGNNSPLKENYILFLDLNRDGINDATVQVYDDGTAIDALPTHKHFGNPCVESSTVHAAITAGGVDLVINPANSPVLDLDIVYVGNPGDPHRDIEFKIGRVHNIPLSSGPNPTAFPYCDLVLSTNADSDYDTSPEVTLNWGRFNFVQAAAPLVSCRKSVNKPKLCALPDTVTYTLQATNDSQDGTVLDLCIVDPQLGGPWCFEDVQPGQTVTVDPAPTKVFGVDFCGADPFVNTMFVSATPANCCATGTVTASCQTTVSPPDTARVRVDCTKAVDVPQLCTLPTTVTYTLTARNSSDTATAVTLKIVDAALGVNQTFTNVPQNATRSVQVQKTFGVDFCGSDPFVNTMNVTATAEGCVCGTTSAVTSCQATVSPPPQARVRVTCTKAVDQPNLCSLPTTVTYTLTARNSSDTNTPVTLKIVDTILGVNQTFNNVAQGDSRSVQVQKTFGVDFCGGDPFVNTMTVTATAEGCACGTTTATTSCQATVNPPPVTRVRVSCNKSVDTPQLCTLPATVTYTLSATNNSLTNTPVTMRIVDAQLGVDQTFNGVPQNGTRSVQVQKTFGVDFCGSNPFVNTMSVSATAEGCACGTVSAVTTCSASVAPPPTARIRVTCTKAVDTPRLCTLPTTVTYTLTARNSSDTNTPVTLRIIDAALGVNQTFNNVPQNATRSVQVQKTFGVDFCGSDPFVNTMTASATAEGCVCGTTSALSTCSVAVTAPPTARVRVTCTKVADPVQLCALPTTVTYTLTARNSSDTNTPVTLKIVDAALGVNQTFTNVPQNATRSVQVQKTFGVDFCGADPFVNTMTVTATAEGCACGTITATTSCQATVSAPEQVRVRVSCNKSADKTEICQLPDTVTYTLFACNISDTNTPITIRIVDTALGVDQTFPNVAQGSCTPPIVIQKTFDETFCGGDPFINTMRVTGSAAGCVCGTVTATSVCSATVSMPQESGLECEVSLDGQTGTVILDKSDLPKLVTYQFKLCNTGTAALDCTIDITDAPPGMTCDVLPGGDGKWHLIIPGGGCEIITCTTTLTPDLVPCPGQIEFNTTMTATAVLADGACACAPPGGVTCNLPLLIRCPGLSQAYPAHSFGLDRTFLGYRGLGGDVITAIGGIFKIVPGDRWSNFVKAARDQWPGGYQIKNVVLMKETPEFIQCNEVYRPRTVTQQGSGNIRTWWPLMYEAPGTKFTLTVLYSTGQVRTGPNPNDVINYDDDGVGPNPPSTVHTDVWEWDIVADLPSLMRLLELFHEIPFGLDEVPLISDEVLYPILKEKLIAVDALLRQGNVVDAGLLLGDFELEVQDACISTSPSSPDRSGSRTGIAQTDENPACCKLLIDVEYIAFKLGLFVQKK